MNETPFCEDCRSCPDPLYCGCPHHLDDPRIWPVND